MSTTTKHNTTITPPLKWHGGKHYLAQRIIAIARKVKHTHRVEPYFGGGAFTLGMPDEMIEGVSEVVNDLNRHLTEFWTVLQSEAFFAAFKREIETVPFSQNEFDLASTDQDMGIVHNAVNFFIRARQSRQGLMKDFATLSRNRTRRGMNEQVSSWLTAIEGLPEVHARLKRVVILNRPAIEVIKQQDGPNTLFYCDPPYVHSTRSTTSDYQHEMSDTDHAELLGVLSEIQGKFLLSGYRCSQYDEAAKEHKWNRHDFEIDNKASSKSVKEIKTECLWTNFAPVESEAQ